MVTETGSGADACGNVGDLGDYRGPHVLTQCRSSPEAIQRMAGSDKRKQSLYFPDRSLSWIVQKAWKIARKEIMKYPSVNEFPGEEDEKEIA